MDYGFVSCMPILVLIAGALITKKIGESMIVASVVGVVLVYKGNFFNAYVDKMYGALTNSSYQFILIIIMCFGVAVKLFQNSGCLTGFGNLVSKVAYGPKKPLFLALLTNVIMFVDDYLNTLGVTFSMREVTDRNGIPREHLAFQTAVMAPSLCVLIPFSSWAAFTVGIASEYNVTMTDYISGIKYMWFPILMVIICILLAAGIFPKIGNLKQAYKRVEKGGPVLPENSGEKSLVNLEMDENIESSSALNFLIPMVVLVAVTIYYDNDLVHGMLAAIATQAVLYIGQRIISPSEFLDICFEGCKSMASMAIIVFFAFIINAVNNEMGFAEYLINGICKALPMQLLPVLIFLIMAFATFATAGYWLMQVIALPIFLPMAEIAGLSPSITLACVMSGVTLGGILCFYSDVIFMTVAGSGVSNVNLVKTITPYAIIGGIFTAAGYLIIGLI